MAYSKKQKAIIIANIINKYPDPEVLKAKLMTSQNAYVKIVALQIDEDWDIYEYQNFLNNHFVQVSQRGKKIAAWILVAVGIGLLAINIAEPLATGAGVLGSVAVGLGIRKLASLPRDKKSNLLKPSNSDIKYGDKVKYDDILSKPIRNESYHIVCESYDTRKIIRPELYIKSAIKKANRCILILNSEIKHLRQDTSTGNTIIYYTRNIKKIAKFKNYCEQVLTVGADQEELNRFVRSGYFKNIENFLADIIASGHDTVID